MFLRFPIGYEPTMAALIAVFLAALLLAFGFAFAAPWLVLVPIAIVIVFVAWVGTLLVARRTPQDAVRSTKRPQLLGPGGPDDPQA
jgi:membrane protein implicated in regulation of membrane protease activity